MVSSDESPNAATTTSEPEPFTVWWGHTTFRKNGTPILGTLGASAKHVVIMESSTFQRLLQEVPELKRVKLRTMDLG